MPAWTSSADPLRLMHRSRRCSAPHGVPTLGEHVETLGAPELSFAGLPMAADRGVGWKAVRDAGRVVYIDGWYYLSHRDDVLAALRNPELFSSKKAFDMLGSPMPLVPIA